MKVLKEIVIALEGLEKRERVVLFAGIYAVIVIVGVFFLLIPTVEKIKKIDKRIEKEIQSYTQLVKLAKEYSSLKRNFKEKTPLTLGEIEELTKAIGIKSKVSSIKPYQDSMVEVVLKDLSSKEVYSFIHEVHKEGIKIDYITVENIDKDLYKVRAVLER